MCVAVSPSSDLNSQVYFGSLVPGAAGLGTEITWVHQSKR